MNGGAAVVSTTVATASEAQALARMLVEARLAACVQVLPVASTYRWNDAVEQADEHLLLCKIMAADYPAVEAAIRESHGYDVPEIVAVPITAGSPDYLAWLQTCVKR